MAIADLVDWLDAHADPSFLWYIKRLSGNDTLANGSHQAGPYIPKEFMFSVFPAINHPKEKNPDVWFDLRIDSHAGHCKARAIWYNNKLHGKPKGGRNETRITQLGGRSSALLDPESTGALAVFAFELVGGAAGACHVWVCRNAAEEELIEDRVGPVEPGTWAMWSSRHGPSAGLFAPPLPRTSCRLLPADIPAAWLTRFPTGAEIIGKVVDMRPDPGIDPDRRLVRRRECEFQLFQSVEEAVELPAITAGFTSVDEFIARAQTVLQRRKARSGRSLELHARQIFIEEGLRESADFAHQPESDPGKRPDFLFPSELAYKDRTFPDTKLRMLAVKTSCKDRWRQVTEEADRIKPKHLLTLQEGVSENQFRQMTGAGVRLVVPSPLVSSYPASVRPFLQTFDSFIRDIRSLRLT